MSMRLTLSARWKVIIAFLLFAGAGLNAHIARAQTIDIVSIDLSQLPQGTPLATAIGIRDAFYSSERFWESRLIGFSAQLPAILQRSVGPVQITAQIVTIDGPGGVLGRAGPTQVASYVGNKPYILSQAGNMEFDAEDAVFYQNIGLFDDIVRHEMAHVLGFGPLWTANRLNLGPFGHYTGAFALKRYRIEAKQPSALYVPVEQLGGPGTARAHWDSASPFFFDARRNGGDLMIGFITDNPTVTETTYAAFADLWFKVKGVNDTIVGSQPGSGGRKTVPLN